MRTLIRSVAALLGGLAVTVITVATIFVAWGHVSWLVPTRPLGLALSSLWIFAGAITAGYVAGLISTRAPILHALGSALLILLVELALPGSAEQWASPDFLQALLAMGAMVLGSAIYRWRSAQPTTETV